MMLWEYVTSKNVMNEGEYLELTFTWQKSNPVFSSAVFGGDQFSEWNVRFPWQYP